MMSNKRYFIVTICIILFLLIVIGGITVIIDPLFHYHKPLDFISYPLNNQRYQNNGIAKNFEYDAIITGTSMTENFKTSQFDELFHTNSVKLPLAGSRFKEQRDILMKAFESDNEIKYVVRSIDDYALLVDKDARSDFDYPDFLYDSNIFNDVNYVLNRSVFYQYTCAVFAQWNTNERGLDFDQYSRWSESVAYGKEIVLQRYTRPNISAYPAEFTEREYALMKANVEQNILAIAKENPDTQFYLFFPPYSIAKWDSWNRQKMIDYKIDVMKAFTELTFECSNISLFSYYDDTDLICNLDNYLNLTHYGGWVNEDILDSFKTGEHILTSSNYIDHFETMRKFYGEYDYEALMSGS